MIPPMGVTVKENQTPDQVEWRNTFNMRQATLLNIASSQLGLKTNGRSQLVFNRMRNSCVISPAKSLELLRKNLQSAINRDIDVVLKKYIHKFFHPAIENLKTNLGADSVNDDLLNYVCRSMLEEAKHIYIHNEFDVKKRKETDEVNESVKRAKSRTPTKQLVSVTTTTRPVKYDVDKWKPERITSDTLFIMGARANKVLGFGQTRGRLYVRHPDLLRYSGDQEDKDWLTRNNLMPANGGKAYLMILDDIKELSQLDEYRNNPNLLLNELKGFEVPPFMLTKIQKYVNQMKSDYYNAKWSSTSIVPNVTVQTNALPVTKGFFFTEHDNASLIEAQLPADLLNMKTTICPSTSGLLLDSSMTTPDSNLMSINASNSLFLNENTRQQSIQNELSQLLNSSDFTSMFLANNGNENLSDQMDQMMSDTLNTNLLLNQLNQNDAGVTDESLLERLSFSSGSDSVSNLLMAHMNSDNSQDTNEISIG